MKKIIITILIIILQSDMFVFSQVKEPEVPGISDVNDKIDFQSFTYKVKIVIQGKSDPIESMIALNSDILILPDNRKIKVKEISKITALSWEKRSRLNKHIFYPSGYEIFYRDYRKENIKGNIESLNKIKMRSKKTGYVYFYYYDYFINGKWANSGIGDFNASSLNPAEGCAVSIELIQ